MPNVFNTIITILFIWLCVTYMNNQSQENAGMRQEVEGGQEDAGMRQEVEGGQEDTGMRQEVEGGQEDTGMRQEVEGGQEDARMRQEVGVTQGINRYALEVLVSIFLIWMSMEGAELPYPIQAVQDPTEGLEQYYQRLVSGRMR